MNDPATQSDNIAMQSLGEVERRIRIHWTRIDAEASGGYADGTFPWIEQIWQAGPNGTGVRNSKCHKSRLGALESMSKCRVFHPELALPLWKEPCPLTRPGVTLCEIVRSGMKKMLKWVRDEYGDNSFPMPRVWEVDDDGWMEVNSLEDLEKEMRNLSYPCGADGGARSRNSERKPKRTTRRSRRKLILPGSDDDDAGGQDGPEGEEQGGDNTQCLDRVLSGFHSFVEGEGEVEGAVTMNNTEDPSPPHQENADSLSADLDPEQLVSREVKVDPRKFLDILHAMLRNGKKHASHASNCSGLYEEKEEASPAIEQDVSKYFFDEDLDDGDASEDSERGRDDDVYDEERIIEGDCTGTSEDPWSLQNIMQAMDHELRTDYAADPSIQNLSVASENTYGGSDRNDADLAILSNFLSSIDAQGDGGSGPATTILRGMGILPPRLPTEDDKDC